jgi:hypothetical protein
MRKTLGLLAALATVLGARADVVFDNTTTYQGMFLASTNEYGDEITLAGTARLLTAFLFEYYGDFTPQGDEMLRFRLYANDGPIYYKEYREPGSLLYDSGFMAIATNVNTIRLWMGKLQVPDTLTYTVQFAGLGQAPGDRAGLLFYDPPTVGAELPGLSQGQTYIGSYPDFWEKKEGEWGLYGYESPHPPANFGAQVLGVVPEPSTIALGLLAAAGWLGCRAARRRWRDRG